MMVWQARKNGCGKVGVGPDAGARKRLGRVRPCQPERGTVCAPGIAVRPTQDRAGQGLASRAFRLLEMRKK
ncbi:hypothetical protein XA67_14575 [Comamonas thiooxydans]|nr:hypothetical protein CTATCC11996_03047 [Comamonas testosteroni ATCC 11996]KKI13402.1 hypothetical protein XA67_14575 [Comamonas thiooxydans]